MNAPQIIFDDGAAYERYMGIWSQKAGHQFLDWLRPAPGLRWLDVGCGNGAFTELIAARCAPAEVVGIDPSEAQLRHARTRSQCASARFEQADAQTLPFPADMFDVAVMPLVIFFVPEPAQGVAEMTRVVRPGGTVSAYSWDMPGKGFPYVALHEEMEAMGVTVPLPPSPDASETDRLLELWTRAGLQEITTHVIRVQRTYTDFEDYWQIVQGGPSAGRQLLAMPPDEQQRLKERLRKRLGADGNGAVTVRATANAIGGRV